MSLKFAVEESIKIWTMLARLGCKKDQLPNYKDVVETYEADCPLCQYYINQDIKFCVCNDECILYKLEGKYCCSTGTAFTLWAAASDEAYRKRFAAMITRMLIGWYKENHNKTFNPYEDE